jgi:protein tyrosine phosphatase (PTP) superfamily phosphohydrolase (DUF442 family)
VTMSRRGPVSAVGGLSSSTGARVSPLAFCYSSIRFLVTYASTRTSKKVYADNVSANGTRG